MLEEGRCVLSGGQAAFHVVWVPVCPSAASGRDVTVGKVNHPLSLWAGLPPSPLPDCGEKAVINQD